MRTGGAGSPATPAAAARSSTWRATRAPIRGESVPRTEKVIRRTLGSEWTLAVLPRRQLLRGDLRLHALRFGGVEIQLDLDAVRVDHEQLVERLPVRATLAELDRVAAQVCQGLSQALRAERDVVDRARAGARILREAPEVGPLVVARVLRAPAYVDDVHAAEVHPVHGKPEVRVPALLHAEHIAVPVASAVHVVGSDKVVFDVDQRHNVGSGHITRLLPGQNPRGRTSLFP